MKKYKVELTGYQWILVLASIKSYVLAREDDSKFEIVYNDEKNSLLSLSSSLLINNDLPVVLEANKDEILAYTVSLLEAMDKNVFNPEAKILAGQALIYLDELI